MRSTNCCISGFLHYHVHRYVHAKRPQAFDDTGRAQMSLLAKLLEACLNKAETRDMQSQNMDFRIAVMRAQLHARNYTHANSFTRFDRARHAGKRVMIS